MMGGAGGGAAARSSAGAVLGGMAFGLQMAHQVGSALAGRMEQTAGHAGMPGAYPYSTISGGQRIAPQRPGGRRGGADPAPTSAGFGGNSDPGSSGPGSPPLPEYEMPDWADDEDPDGWR